jgi:multiple sugar transport system permease protein
VLRTLPRAEKPRDNFTNNNLVAAGSLLVAIPTLIVFFVLQRHFVAGLTMGANKG